MFRGFWKEANRSRGWNSVSTPETASAPTWCCSAGSPTPAAGSAADDPYARQRHGAPGTVLEADDDRAGAATDRFSLA